VHAKYQVAMFNISKVNISKVIARLPRLKFWDRMTDRQAKNNIPPIIRTGGITIVDKGT